MITEVKGVLNRLFETVISFSHIALSYLVYHPSCVETVFSLGFPMG